MIKSIQTQVRSLPQVSESGHLEEEQVHGHIGKSGAYVVIGRSYLHWLRALAA